MVQPHCANTFQVGQSAHLSSAPIFPLGFSADYPSLSYVIGSGDLCKDGFCHLLKPFKFSHQQLHLFSNNDCEVSASVTIPNMVSIIDPVRPFVPLWM